MLDARPIDQALDVLLEHLSPQLHLVITTREDPPLPLARLRAADLRFSPAEAAAFLKVMGLNLSAEEIAALEERTEGWVAGRQLAALSMQGLHDATHLIQSFTGSPHFVLDYLVEEVLEMAFVACQHVAAANDSERAARLIEGEGIPRHFRSAVTTILDWLRLLPRTALDARPSLWWRCASLLLANGHMAGVEEKLQAAEAGLQSGEADDKTRSLIGKIATLVSCVLIPGVAML